MDESDRQRILDWDRTLDAASYYEILGVLEIADEASIRQAFHVFSLAFHPDVHLDADPDMAARVRRVFQRGAEAYRVLSHAQQRADYDLTLAKGHVRLGVPSIPPGSTSSGVRSTMDLKADLLVRRSSDNLRTCSTMRRETSGCTTST